jgi:hypothetical protein
MPELLMWMIAVFAVLGVPPLLAALAAWRKERRAANERKVHDRHGLVRLVWPVVASLGAV